jgi:hypothetical protein
MPRGWPVAFTTATSMAPATATRDQATVTKPSKGAT